MRCTMIDELSSNVQQYEFHIRGHLDTRWSNHFEGMTITLEADGTSLLSGPVTDQAALHGLLKKLRDLGMTLVSVIQIQSL